MKKQTKRLLQRNIKIFAVCGTALFLAITIIQASTTEEREPVETITIKAASFEPQIQTADAEDAADTCETEQELQPDETDDPKETGDEYLLAKIAMAEAEGEDLEGKALVIRTVLNRVQSKYFPDTVEEVIYERTGGGGWQFSPLADGGRWYTTTPNKDCYDAVDMVMSGWDESQGALYFESRSDSEWHRNHLQYIFKHGKHYFYKNKG